jgi:hypothetical protein
MEFPNLSWAMSYRKRTNYDTAAAAGISESGFSRKLNGRLCFSPMERENIARFLNYSEDWLFAPANPPLSDIRSPKDDAISPAKDVNNAR